jgi:hypothetical protein
MNAHNRMKNLNDEESLRPTIEIIDEGYRP